MKKVLKYSGIISLIAAGVGFVLMMVTPALFSQGEFFGVKLESWYSGTAAIFGKGKYQYPSGSDALIGNFDGNLAWNALIAWIFVLVSLVILLLGFILPMLKIRVLEKFAGILNLVTVGLLIAAGIFMFFTVPTFASANNFDTDGWNLGAGWWVAAFLTLGAGVFAALPTIADLTGKRK